MHAARAGADLVRRARRWGRACPDARWPGRCPIFASNIGPLAERFRVLTPELRGHGHTPDVEEPITYQLMTYDTIALLEQVVGEPADLVGHGAFVAMQVGMQRPDLVKRLVLISGGFNKSGEAMPDMEWNSNRSPIPGSGVRRGVPGRRGPFPVVAAKIGEMAAAEPNLDKAELTKVTARTLGMFADDDLMTLQHAVEMFQALPTAELAIVPGTRIS